MMRVGIVGVGHMGWLHARHVPAGGATLTAVFDTDVERAQRAATEFGARAASSLDELASTCDAAVIAVPTSAHAAAATTCLANGLHVLVEKPMAASVAEARAIADAAERAGRVLAVGHVERWNPVVLALAPEIESPLFVEAHRLAPFVPRSVDVDVVLDLMIHDLDLILSRVPGGAALESVDASGVPVLTRREDIANARVTFSSGLVANVTASRVSRERLRRIRFFSGNRSYIALDLFARTGEIVRLARDPSAYIARGETPPLGALLERRRVGPFPDANPLADQLQDFIRAAATRARPRVGADAGIRALELALTVRERVASGLARMAGPRA